MRLVVFEVLRLVAFCGDDSSLLALTPDGDQIVTEARMGLHRSSLPTSISACLRCLRQLALLASY